MTWQPITCSVPGTLQSVAASLDGALAGTGAHLDECGSRLDAVARSYAPPTPSTDAAGADDLRQELAALLAAGGTQLCVHPFLHPLGDRRGDYAYMTPQQAVEAVAGKMADPADALPSGGQLAAVLLVLRGVAMDDFAVTLDAFNAVFPVAELRMVARRARALATLEQDKFLRPQGPEHPAWRHQDPRRHDSPEALARTLGRRLAMAEAYARDSLPEDELGAVVAKKREQLAETAGNWTRLAERLAGGSAVGLHLDGDAGSIRRQLLEQVPAVEGYKLAAAVCWIGPAERITLYRECFGL
jgi:hypothetical protein